MSNRILAWTDEAWDNYIYWQNQDRKTLKKINKIIKLSKFAHPTPLLQENLFYNFTKKKFQRKKSND